jgi:hypothetical protein
MEPLMSHASQTRDHSAAADLYRRNVELLEAHVNEELVALDPHKGTCYGFNGVATEVWRKLVNPKTFDQIEAELLVEYDVPPAQCTEELKALLTDLEQRGLIVIERAGAPG